VVQRPSPGAGAAHPRLQDLLAHAGGRLGGQVQQDRQLRAVVQPPADEVQRIGIEYGAELRVGEPEPVRQQRGSAQKSWFSPPKTSLTESSVKIRRIESVSSSAQERTRTLSGAPARSGIVSVTTISSNPADDRFS
jgi:hypothetical protein